MDSVAVCYRHVVLFWSAARFRGTQIYVNEGLVCFQTYSATQWRM